MKTKVNTFWWRWLLVVIIGVMLFSAAMILLPDTMQAFFNALVFPTTDTTQIFSPEAVNYIKFVYGFLGAVMIGWMVALLFIVFGTFRRGEREGWYAVLVSIVTWYVLDCGWSLYTGFHINVLLNSGFLVLFIIPLAATYGDFHAIDLRSRKNLPG
jgi:hypothetical protein